MPKYVSRKYPKRKRVFRRKRVIKRRRGVRMFPSKALRPVNYFFKRKTAEVLTLSPTTEPPYWLSETVPGTTTINAITKQFVFALSDLVQFTEFQSLFTSYKINAVSIKIYPATGIGGGSTATGSQVMVYTNANQQGVNETLDDDYYLQSQTTKRRLLLNNTGRPLNYFMKLKQLSLRYHTTLDSDYVMTRPKFCSTGEPGIDHYGVNCRIATINGTGFNTISLRIETTYYLQFKQVK